MRVSFVICILHRVVPHTGPVRTSRDLVVHVPNKSFAFAKAAVINRLQINNILVDKRKNQQKGSIWRTPFIGVETNNIVQQGPGMEGLMGILGPTNLLIRSLYINLNISIFHKPQIQYYLQFLFSFSIENLTTANHLWFLCILNYSSRC